MNSTNRCWSRATGFIATGPHSRGDCRRWIGGRIFSFQIMIEAAQLLPLDDRKCGIERVEISDLNVARILPRSSGSAKETRLRRCSRCCCVLAVTRTIPPSTSSVKSIPMPTSIKETPNASTLQLSSCEQARCRCRGIRNPSSESIAVGIRSESLVIDDPPMHLRIDILQVPGLPRPRPEFVQGWCAWATKGIVGKELAPSKRWISLTESLRPDQKRMSRFLPARLSRFSASRVSP